MFDKIKSLFIVEDPNAAKAKTAPKKAAKSTPTQKPTAPAVKPTNTAPSAAPDGKISDKFVNVLTGAMDKNNLDGFDYLEFKQSLRNLDKMAMDEATKYKSAYAMAQTMGATPEKLVQTAGHYVKVLQQEQAKFGQALDNQRSKQIGGKEDAIKKTDALIKQKKQQIEALQKEITQHEKQMQSALQEISGAKVKLETTKRNFEVTYNAIAGQIMGDINNIKKYLTK